MAMLGGISHDVRTFATRLRLRVDAIADVEQRQRAVADIADMIRLLDDALLAGRAGVGELTAELVEVDDVVRDDVDDRALDGGTLTLNIEPGGAGATVLGDRLAVRRIVSNLLDNALKHGRRVEVGLGCVDATVTLTVDDDGPGIRCDQRELLLEPFVRLESSRNRRTGVPGSDSRSCATWSRRRGSVGISDGPPGGARLTVTLPVCVS